MYKPTRHCRTRLFGAGQRVPSVILYMDRHIGLRDVKNFCFAGANGSVLAVDKTYNLGAIYCTVTVYKNTAVLRCRSGDHPVFAGWPFRHETYSFFFGGLPNQLYSKCFHLFGTGFVEMLNNCFKAAVLPPSLHGIIRLAYIDLANYSSC